jgi:hypothetical protein
VVSSDPRREGGHQNVEFCDWDQQASERRRRLTPFTLHLVLLVADSDPTEKPADDSRSLRDAVVWSSAVIQLVRAAASGLRRWLN